VCFVCLCVIFFSLPLFHLVPFSSSFIHRLREYHSFKGERRRAEEAKHTYTYTHTHTHRASRSKNLHCFLCPHLLAYSCFCVFTALPLTHRHTQTHTYTQNYNETHTQNPPTK
jgi:hypothetical protein